MDKVYMIKRSIYDYEREYTTDIACCTNKTKAIEERNNYVWRIVKNSVTCSANETIEWLKELSFDDDSEAIKDVIREYKEYAAYVDNFVNEFCETCDTDNVVNFKDSFDNDNEIFITPFPVIDSEV